MEVPSNAVPSESLEETVAKALIRLGAVESLMSCMQESVNTVVGNLMPKVEALLSERNEAEGSAASSPAPPLTVAPPTTSLLELAERGDGDTLFRLLADTGVDLRSNPPRAANGDTALHVAASGGHLKAVMILLGAGARVNVSGSRLRTPLHCAAAHGHLAVAQRLLYAGAKVDVMDADSCSAWDLAVRSNKEMVELFLQEGASVDACDGKGVPVLVQAAKEKRWEIVQLLLEKGACATKCQKDQYHHEGALVYASREGQADVVRHLLQRGASSNIDQMKYGLAGAKSAAVVWAIVDVAVDKVRGDFGTYGLVCTARDGLLESMIALLEAGVDVNSKGSGCQTALYTASCSGRTSCVKELLRRGANPNLLTDYSQNTSLHAASENGHVECVRALLAAGAKVTQTNRDRKTPLDVSKTDAVRRVFNEQ